MTVNEVKQTIQMKLPARLVSLIDELGITISVHSPEQCDPPRDNSLGTYVYSIDREVELGDEHPWRSTEPGLEDGFFIGNECTQQQISNSIDSLCSGYIRARK